MIAPKFIPLTVRQLLRHRIRSFLTLSGVMTAMFMFIAIQAMQTGVSQATRENADDTVLVVYRKDRFCPFTSQLPQYYESKIRGMEGVRAVIPMKIVVNNCRTSLDVVTFRGVPLEEFLSVKSSEIDIIQGSVEQWRSRSDAALLGETLARRRGLKVGDRFDAAGVTAYVAGVVRSQEVQDHNVAYVHLDFLQQTADKNLGIVTQFNVLVEQSSRLDDVAQAIDQEFSVAEHPTTTRSEKAFVAHAAADMVELVAFTRYLGWSCIAAVLILVGNAIVLSVQDRVKEHAILQTLGYSPYLIGRLIVFEGLCVGLFGGSIGTLAAAGIIEWGQYSLSVDGLSIPIQAGLMLTMTGMGLSVILGVAAGLVPAWQASRQEIAQCFRAV
ncbi:MAG: ABC transporter permease [Planctomycetota bacterium]|jgi:putative ABC transport system permease protein